MAAGPYQLYIQLKLKVKGTGLNSIYAIIGAQQDRHWQDIKRDMKEQILMRLDDLGFAPK